MHRAHILAKMARQCLATPATSAEVERFFSAAGLHYSMQLGSIIQILIASSMHEDTLSHRLLTIHMNFISLRHN